MNELTFKVGEVEYKVRKPNREDKEEAEVEKMRVFNKALKSKSPLQSAVPTILREQGLWDDSKQSELESLQKDILQKEFILHQGGIYKKEARKIAIELRKLRAKAQEVFLPIANFNVYTCEGQARNAEFNYLVSKCVVYTDNRPYFESYDDYVMKDNDPVAILGSNKFAELYYGMSEDEFGANSIENQFLKEHGFVDSKMRLIDNKGRLITEDGRLIDENGNLIDEEGNLVDVLGHKLDKDGNFIVERKPFLDDEADSEQDSAST